MPPARPDSAARLSGFLIAGGLACLAILTLIDRGATRAYSSPWIWLFWFARIAPLAAVTLRAFSRGTSFALPSRPWLVLAAAVTATVLASAASSPFRGPSLLCALTPLAGFATFLLAYDWLCRNYERRHSLLSATGLFFAAVVAVSLVRWICGDLIASDTFRDWSSLLEHRNAHPLGHSNYTAGLALLALPCLGALAYRSRSRSCAGWTLATLLALAMLFASGSRGGLIGLAALALAALFQARLGWKKLLFSTLAAIAIAIALAFAHPRTRAMLFTRRLPSAAPNISNVQRSAMLHAGLRMGKDRPALGWGPGTTPLLYPRYRAGLDGGAENVLQLHSTPVQLWADLGLAGLVCAIAFLWLATSAARTAFGEPLASTASIALAGYAAFSLTDYQLDVPVFTFAIAVCAAALAAATPGDSDKSSIDRRATARFGIGAFSLLALALVALFGHCDPTPALNVRALALAREPAQTDRAIALLHESLALNPDQEIAHFNLGWLLVVRDPPAAERHFLAAAHLVPDKGGVYFGLALARLNQDRRAAAAHALALECLNDPLFLTSPWWRQPAIAALRAATIADFRNAATRATSELAARRDPRSRDALYIAALAAWLDGQASPGEILARAQTPERVSFFAARPPVPDFAAAPIRAYRRERTGYPVLTRNLDLPPPVDLFDVQENRLAADELSFLFPPKGWLPAPLLIELLDAPRTKS